MKPPSHRARIVELFRADPVSTESQSCTEVDGFQGAHGESVLAPVCLSTKGGYLQISGYDRLSREWLPASPPLTCLPKPDEQRFHFAGARGLLCVNVSKDPRREKLVLCNPQTQKTLVLPPLNLRRNPVLIHLSVNHATYSCKVIVAGSSREGSSKCTEVFDSETWKWMRVGNIPGPEFCLNDYQNGVCIDGKLFCIAFLDDDSGKGFSAKGVVAFNLDEEKWTSDLKFPLPFSTSSSVTSNMQLLECDEDLYLFSERKDKVEGCVYHCVEKLENIELGTTGIREWRNVVKCDTGGYVWSYSVYPEYTCVPHGEGRICIFNNIDHKGVVHDTVHGLKVDLALPSARNGEERYYSSNPLSFCFLPRSFRGSVGEDLEQELEGTKVNNNIHFSEDVSSCPTYLCVDMVESVFLQVPGYEELSQMKLTSKSVKGFLESDYFYNSRGNTREIEGSFTLLMFAAEEGKLLCVAFDLIAKKWRRLPPFAWTSFPVNSLLIDHRFLVAGGGGLLCVTVTDPSNPGTFVVYNPLTNKRKTLPPSIFRRNPVLMHLLTNPETNSYKLIVAGSSFVGNNDTGRFTEVFDSQTGEWTVTGDVPEGLGDIALVDHQTGVYSKGFLYCIAKWRLVEGVKVILAYDVERGEWLGWNPPLPYPQETGPFGPRYTIAQLVVCDDEVYLFSETGHFWNKRSCLDKLNYDMNTLGDDAGNWSNMWTKARPNDNDSGMLVCVPYGPGKVCIFNKTQFTGVVYDILENPTPHIPSTPQPFTPGEASFCLNSFRSIFEPSFKPRP